MQFFLFVLIVIENNNYTFDYSVILLLKFYSKTNWFNRLRPWRKQKSRLFDANSKSVTRNICNTKNSGKLVLNVHGWVIFGDELIEKKCHLKKSTCALANANVAPK